MVDNFAGSQTILGVVLAGGRSQRMGCDKALLPHPIHPGVSLLGHAIEQISRVTASNIVSGTKRDSVDSEFLPDLPCYEDTCPMGGVITTLMWAQARGYAGCLYLPIDMPMVDYSLLQSIVLNAKPDCGICIVARSTVLEPLLAYYPVTLVDALEKAWQRGHRSLRRWLECQCLVSVLVSRQKTINVNTPSDLEELRQRR